MEKNISSLIIDQEAGIRRVGGDQEFYIELVSLFIDESTRQVRELEDALNALQADSVEKLAHSIKGAASNIGALQVQQTAFELEELGRNKSIENAGSKAKILEAQINRIRKFLETDS